MWSSTALTGCAKACTSTSPRWTASRREAPARRRRARQDAAAGKIRTASVRRTGATTVNRSAGGARGQRAGATIKRCDERLRTLHSASGRHLAADGGDHALRHGGLYVPAAVDAARGRLSDHPGADALSRRQSRSDDLVGHGAAGAAVRPDAGIEPDDVGELR